MKEQRLVEGKYNWQSSSTEWTIILQETKLKIYANGFEIDKEKNALYMVGCWDNNNNAYLAYFPLDQVIMVYDHMALPFPDVFI